MLLKNKVVIFGFQDHFFCLQTQIFSLEWKKILSKIFGFFTTKKIDKINPKPVGPIWDYLVNMF